MYPKLLGHAKTQTNHKHLDLLTPHMVRLRGEGAQNVQGRGKGDLYVRFTFWVFLHCFKKFQFVQ